MRRFLLLLPLFAAPFACKRDDARSANLPILKEAPAPRFASQAVLHERSGRGAVAYLGLDAKPETPERGQIVEITQYYRVEAECQGDYDVFFHGDVPGGGGHAVV